MGTELHWLLNGGDFIEFVPHPLNSFCLLFLLLMFFRRRIHRLCGGGGQMYTLNTCVCLCTSPPHSLWFRHCLLLARSQTQIYGELRESETLSSWDPVTASRSHRRPGGAGSPGAMPRLAWERPPGYLKIIICSRDHQTVGPRAKSTHN